MIAVLASLVVALTVAPALAPPAGRSPGVPARSPLLRRARPLRVVLDELLWRVRPTCGRRRRDRRQRRGGRGLAVASGTRGSLVPPPSRSATSLVRMDGAPGASPTEMNRIVGRAGAELRAVPGVQNVGGHVGRAIISDQRRARPSRDLGEHRPPSRLRRHPGLDRSGRRRISRPRPRRPDVLPPVAIDDGPRLDRTTTSSSASTVRTWRSSQARAEAGPRWSSRKSTGRRPAAERPSSEPDGRDRGRPRRGRPTMALKPGDIRRQATSLLSGIEVGNLFEDQKVFEVVVWGTPELRHSVDERARPADRHTVRRSSSGSATSRACRIAASPARDQPRRR